MHLALRCRIIQHARIGDCARLRETWQQLVELAGGCERGEIVARKGIGDRRRAGWCCRWCWGAEGRRCRRCGACWCRRRRLWCGIAIAVELDDRVVEVLVGERLLVFLLEIKLALGECLRLHLQLCLTQRREGIAR